MAESSSLGFFFAGDIKTSEQYVGMNSMDMAGIMFGGYEDIISKYKNLTSIAEKNIRDVYQKYEKEEKQKIGVKKEELALRFVEIGFNEEEANTLAETTFENKMDWEKIQSKSDKENEENGNNARYKEIQTQE